LLEDTRNFKKWDHQDDNYSHNLRNGFLLEKRRDYSCLLHNRSCTARKRRWHPVWSLDLCRDCPFVGPSWHLAAQKASCLSSPASLSCPARKSQTFPFFNMYFEGACTSHTWGPSAGYSCNTLQECFSICQPVQFRLSVLLGFL